MAIRQLNIEGKTYYFYNDLINIKTFNINKLKLDKKGCFGQGCLFYWIYNKNTTIACF